MILPGRLLWWVSLTLRLSTCSGLEIFGPDHGDDMICSQSLSECTMKDEIALLAENFGMEVADLRTQVKLCSENNHSCSVCLVIDVDVGILANGPVYEGSSEPDDYEAFVTVCYKTPSTLPACKKVEFTVNHRVSMQEHPAKISMVITRPSGVSFGSTVIVYAPDFQLLTQEVNVPSLDRVCFLEVKKCVEECQVPKLRIVPGRDSVELQFDDSDNRDISVCVQYEENGSCQNLNRSTIPLYSVASCMCFMVWYHDSLVRSKVCPFTDTDFSRRAVWKNVSVTVRQGQTINYSTSLLWNLSAPCRLKGEVWPCYKENSCKEINGFRQQLKNGTWSSNGKGFWENVGAFADVDLELSPCVMVKIEGMTQQLGPFCFRNTDRHHWTPLLILMVIVMSLTMFLLLTCRGLIKKWVWSCHHGGFVKIGKKAHVILLSPPDNSDGVLESVCRLGSLLHGQGFDVAVDQWSRTEQSSLGPLLWFHSQLLKMNQHDSRVVVILTQNGLEKIEEWAHQTQDIVPAQTESPYSDLFTASLCVIQADQQRGRAAEHFLLVQFDSCPVNYRNLPEILQGLPLFHLPSQTQALLTELSLKKTSRNKNSWREWKWSGSDGWRAKTKMDHSREINKPVLIQYSQAEVYK